MTHYDIPVDTTDSYRSEHYGVIYSSRFVYEVRRKWSGPTRLDVWDNTHRPNPYKGFKQGDTVQVTSMRTQVLTEWFVESNRKFHADPLTALYTDPSGNPTNDPITYLLTPEASCITSNGTNTGTVASGQVYAKGVDPMHDGDTATLSYPDGSTVDVLLHFPPHRNDHGFATLQKGRVNA